MERAWLVLATLICAYGVTEARWTVRPKTTTTTTPIVAEKATTTVRPPIDSASTQLPAEAESDDTDRSSNYHPMDIQQPRLIEQYDHRSLDGHYEYRYVLSNGDTRYERAYWLPVGNTKVLARKGFYSYPLPNRQFMTVFYTADHNGYHQDSSKYSSTQPLLPRSLIVPEHEPPEMPSTPAPAPTWTPTLSWGEAHKKRRGTRPTKKPKIPQTKINYDEEIVAETTKLRSEAKGPAVEIVTDGDGIVAESIVSTVTATVAKPLKDKTEVQTEDSNTTASDDALTMTTVSEVKRDVDTHTATEAVAVAEAVGTTNDGSSIVAVTSAEVDEE